MKLFILFNIIFFTINTAKAGHEIVNYGIGAEANVVKKYSFNSIKYSDNVFAYDFGLKVHYNLYKFKNLVVYKSGIINIELVKLKPVVGYSSLTNKKFSIQNGTLQQETIHHRSLNYLYFSFASNWNIIGKYRTCCSILTGCWYFYTGMYFIIDPKVYYLLKSLSTNESESINKFSYGIRIGLGYTFWERIEVEVCYSGMLNNKNGLNATWMGISLGFILL